MSAGTYPESCINLANVTMRKNAKRQFRDSAMRYQLKDGLLFHDSCPVARANQVEALLIAMHNNPVTGGQFGHDKTFQKVPLG